MGVIVDALDGRPVANARVTLGGALAGSSTTEILTDAEGRFVFTELPKGTYTITATRPGYAEGAHGRRRPSGLTQVLMLAEGERIGGLKIPIWKHAIITGRITDEAGEPMVAIGVRVLQRTIVAGKRKLTPGPEARTDDRGIYRIASLTPGDYVVVVASTQASAPASIVDAYRQRRTGGLKPGESDFIRDSSFSGAAATMNLLERHTGASLGTLTFLSTGGGSRAGIAPMPSSDGRIHVYPTQYYPDASTSAGAVPITLRSGEERDGVDLQLELVPTSRVSGTVTGPDGPRTVMLSLAPDSDDLSTEMGLETATTLSDASGRFTFLGVPAGQYRLRAIWAQVPVSGAGRGAPPPSTARPAEPTAPAPALGGFTLWGAQPITVGDTDIDDVAVTVRAGFRLAGQAVFDGGTSQPSPDALRRMSATFDPADARPLVAVTIGRGQFDQSGRLSTYQLPPGRYYLRITNAPAGWTLDRAIVNGRDITNVPVMLDRDGLTVSISFTDRPTSLAGQVSGPSGSADASATVLIFPADASGWSDYGDFPRRLRAIRVDRDGRYSLGGLPAGDYLVVAIADESSADWQDPETLEALATLATPITLGAGESRTTPLRTMVRR